MGGYVMQRGVDDVFRGAAHVSRSKCLCRHAKSRAAWSCVALMVICLASQTVRAEETGAEEPRWIPSFNVAFDTGDHDPDVSVDSSVGQSGADDDAFDNLVFRLGGELMSPILGELPV
jgi:hypothetical protein